MLLTNNWSSLWEVTNEKETTLFYAPSSSKNHERISYQHLYFISDDEVKKGDWSLNIISGTLTNWIGDSNTSHKVIASTDPSLGLPLIPRSYIQEYVNSNGSITDVGLEMEEQYPENRIVIRNNEVVVVSKSIRISDSTIDYNDDNDIDKRDDDVPLKQAIEFKKKDFRFHMLTQEQKKVVNKLQIRFNELKNYLIDGEEVIQASSVYEIVMEELSPTLEEVAREQVVNDNELDEAANKYSSNFWIKYGVHEQLVNTIFRDGWKAYEKQFVNKSVT